MIPPSRASNGTDHERVYVNSSTPAIVALSIDSGKKAWVCKLKEFVEEQPVLFHDQVISAGKDGSLYSIDADKGILEWKFNISENYCSDHNQPVVLGDLLVAMKEATLYAIDSRGTLQWSLDLDRDYGLNERGSQVYLLPTITESGFFIESHSGLSHFVPGAPPALPAATKERRALIQELIGRLDSLSKEQMKLLTKGGTETFEILLPHIRSRMAAYQGLAHGEKTNKEKKEQALQHLRKCFSLLSETATEEQTDQLIAMLKEARSPECRDGIVECLFQKGEEEKTISLFLEILKGKPPAPRSREQSYYCALTRILESRDKRAIDFLCQVLADTQGNPMIRHHAFVALARNGGERGEASVLAAREEERTIPPFDRFLHLDSLPPPISDPEFSCGFLEQIAHGGKKGLSGAKREKLSLLMIGNKAESTGIFDNQLISMKSDRDGTKWGLMASAASGSVFDLWVLHQKKGAKMIPLFTGISYLDLEDSRSSVSIPTIEELMIDSDGDGWPDILERRLSSDPTNPDTDGDGIPDSSDKNPVAAPRELNEREQILKAAFEARFKFGCGRNVPCLVKLPSGLEPFEFTGWDWVVIPCRKGKKHFLDAVKDQGVAIVSFNTPKYDFEDRKVCKDDIQDYILWNRDHSEAKLELEAFYGGLDATGYEITLRKSGKDWFVTKMKMTWIS